MMRLGRVPPATGIPIAVRTPAKLPLSCPNSARGREHASDVGAALPFVSLFWIRPMKGIAFGLLLTVVGALLSLCLTLTFGGSEGVNFLLSLGGTLMALVIDFAIVV